MTYKCPRCGYTTIQRGDIKKHFKRKKICSAVCRDISIEECLNEVLGDTYIKSGVCNPNVTLNQTSCNPNVTLNQTPCNPNVTLNKNICNPNVTLCNPNVTLCNSGVVSDMNICRYCNKIFNKRQHKWRHEKNCKERLGFTTDEVNKKIAEVNAAKDAIMLEKDKIIDELKKQIEVLLTKVGNTTNNTYNTIVINAFGKENMDYIKGGFVKELLNKGPYSAIPKLLKEIHFNPEHKENCNVMIPNRKESYAKRYNGERWEFADKNLTLEDMSDKAFNVLTEYGSGKKFDKFYDDYDDQETGLLKKMKKETEMMILNNQKDI